MWLTAELVALNTDLLASKSHSAAAAAAAANEPFDAGSAIEAYAVWTDHSLPVTHIHCAIGGSNGRVLSSSRDRTVKLWDLANRTLLHSFLFPASISTCVMDAAERWIFAAAATGSTATPNATTTTAASAASAATDGLIYQIDLVRGRSHSSTGSSAAAASMHAATESAATIDWFEPTVFSTSAGIAPVVTAGSGGSGSGSGSDEVLVQREIFYCSGLEFYAFDIAIQRTVSAPKEYIDFSRALDLFEQHKLFYAKPLFVGSLADCTNFDVNFNTTIPARLGLPPIAGNFAEGVVIKPLLALLIDTAKSKSKVRAIFKHKAQRFDERVREQNASSKGGSGGAGGGGGGKNAQCLALLTSFVTANRLTNLVSKTGTGGKSKSGGGGKKGGAAGGAAAPSIDAYIADVMADAHEDETVEAAWTALDASAQKHVTGELKKAVEKLFDSRK